MTANNNSLNSAQAEDDFIIDERDIEPDGCLHGVPWDQDCWECDVEEDRLDMGIL